MLIFRAACQRGEMWDLNEPAYVVVAHGVHVVLQVTLPVVGQDDPAQLPVSSEVEAGVGREHEQTGDVPPADLILGSKRRNSSG